MQKEYVPNEKVVNLYNQSWIQAWHNPMHSLNAFSGPGQDYTHYTWSFDVANIPLSDARGKNCSPPPFEVSTDKLQHLT